MKKQLANDWKSSITKAMIGVAVVLAMVAACLPTQSAEAQSYYNYNASRNTSASSLYNQPSASNKSTSPSSSLEAKILQSVPADNLWTAARNHIGEHGTIVGKVISVSYRPDVNGKPTFINIGADYPSTNRVQVVIWGSDRYKFSTSPETAYKGQWIAVTGTVKLYKGVPEIIVNSPSQIGVYK